MREHIRYSSNNIKNQKYDIIVVGGGIVGTGIALDATLRGFKVLLIDKDDIASGASSKSSKMFHGGLRYLQNLHFHLVNESLHERDLVATRIAPFLVHSTPFMYVLQHHVTEKFYVGAGLALYNYMSTKHINMVTNYNRQKTIDHFPSLNSKSVIGGLLYQDTLMDDARYSITVAKTAQHYGAHIATYTEMLSAIHKDNKVIGVRAFDKINNCSMDIYADTVVSALGPWSDSIQQLFDVESSLKIKKSKGVHIVVKKEKLFGDVALIIPTETSVLFVLPWKDQWIIGTTESDWNLNVDDQVATREDIDYILAQVNRILKDPIDYSDINGVYSGIRPLVYDGSDNLSSISREHVVTKLKDGLIAVAGGKYTTYRVMAKDTVDMVLKSSHTLNNRSCTTDKVPLLGGDTLYFDLNADDIATQYNVSSEMVDHCINRYGTKVYDVLNLTKDDSSLLSTVMGCDYYLKAEIVYAILYEFPIHISDILMRRTRIYFEYQHRGLSCIDEVGLLMQKYLNWSDIQLANEITDYKNMIYKENLSNLNSHVNILNTY